MQTEGRLVTSLTTSLCEVTESLPRHTFGHLVGEPPTGRASASSVLFPSRSGARPLEFYGRRLFPGWEPLGALARVNPKGGKQEGREPQGGPASFPKANCE